MMENRFKFRAWDIVNKKMIYNVFPINNIAHAVTAEDCDFGSGKGTFKMHTCTNDRKYPLMQCTGLSDKNGKDIWEGDVVQLPYIDPIGKMHFDTPNRKGVIIFKNGFFAIDFFPEPVNIENFIDKKEGEYIANYGNLTIYKNTIFKIIGNRFENPELLKEANK